MRNTDVNRVNSVCSERGVASNLQPRVETQKAGPNASVRGGEKAPEVLSGAARLGDDACGEHDERRRHLLGRAPAGVAIPRDVRRHVRVRGGAELGQDLVPLRPSKRSTQPKGGAAPRSPFAYAHEGSRLQLWPSRGVGWPADRPPPVPPPPPRRATQDRRQPPSTPGPEPAKSARMWCATSSSRHRAEPSAPQARCSDRATGGRTLRPRFPSWGGKPARITW